MQIRASQSRGNDKVLSGPIRKTRCVLRRTNRPPRPLPNSIRPGWFHRHRPVGSGSRHGPHPLFFGESKEWVPGPRYPSEFCGAEKLGRIDLQSFGEPNQLPVGHAPNLGLHLGQRLPADIPTGNLQPASQLGQVTAREVLDIPNMASFRDS